MDELISVVIPTKDRSEFVRRAIDSIQEQLYTKIEIIVVDDCSIDDTYQVIKDFYPDVVYIRNPKVMGGAISRNIGAAKASGSFIAFLDSDDEFLSNHLTTAISLINNEGYDGVFSAFEVSYGENDNVLPSLEDWNSYPNNILEYILGRGGGDARTSTFVFKRNVFDNIRFNEQLLKHQDWDFVARFTEKYLLGFSKKISVILHVNSTDRMSFNSHFKSTTLFVDAHFEKVSLSAQNRFFFKRAIFLLEKGVNSEELKYYIEKGISNSKEIGGIEYIKFLALKYRLISKASIKNAKKLKKIIMNLSKKV